MRLTWRITIFSVAVLTGCATPPPTTPVQVKILAINDFHGNLKPPQGGIRIQDPAGPEQDDQRAGRRRRAPGHGGRPNCARRTRTTSSSPPAI